MILCHDPETGIRGNGSPSPENRRGGGGGHKPDRRTGPDRRTRGPADPRTGPAGPADPRTGPADRRTGGLADQNIGKIGERGKKINLKEKTLEK
jgi:hypothetical protein